MSFLADTFMMSYPIESKLVIAVSSSALFELRESDLVFRSRDLDSYRRYQREHENEPLHPGVAYPLIRRLLALNNAVTNDIPVEVVLLSRNDPDTGLRVFKSIEAYGLDISRAAFVGGSDPFKYLEAFHASLFLSANAPDVSAAIAAGVAAAQVLPTAFEDDPDDDEIRIAFDFDGVLADDSAEQVFQQRKLHGFLTSEAEQASVPLLCGPLHRFLAGLTKLQSRERSQSADISQSRCRLRTAIVTARNAPAHERVIQTLRHWGLEINETFFLGGIDKACFLRALKPHIFFDDQLLHVAGASRFVPSAHVPFGTVNQMPSAVTGRLPPVKRKPGQAASVLPKRNTKTVPA